jgi:hypothetical protein
MAAKLKPGLIPGLFIITIIYFALGFVNILTALSAVFCMAIPFILLSRSGKKLWCQHYCPRASLISLIGKPRARWRRLPKMFTDGYLRKIMLWYFGLNLLFITGSTIQIAMGTMEPMEHVRLFIALPLPGPLPQLLAIPAVIPGWLSHLSYRFYSMMLSSTLLGIAFSRIYRPRAWCAVCPVGSLSNTLLKQKPIVCE